MVRRRLTIWLAATAATIVLLLIVAAVALPRLIDTPRIQSLVASQVSHTLGRPVTFSSLSVGLFPLPAVELSNLRVAEDPKFGTSPFVQLERFALKLKLRPLLTGRIEFGDIVLKKPVIAVIQDAQGRFNFASLGAAPAEPRAPSSKPRTGGGGGGAAVLPAVVKIDDGVVTFTTRSGGRAQNYRIEDLDVAVETAVTGMTFKGSGRLRPGDLALKFADGRLTMNGGKALTESALSAKLSIDGRQVKDLVSTVLGPTPAVAGSMKGSLVLAGTVGNPRAAGDVALSDVAVTQNSPNCPEPKQRTLKLDPLKVNLVYEDGNVLLRPVTTGIGNAPITTNVAATLEGLNVQTRDLAIKSVPLEKVLVDFLCQGYAVTGPLDLTGVLSFSGHDLWHTLGGSGQLKIGPGKVVGPQALALLSGITRVGGTLSALLAADLPPNLFASPLDFESITGTYQIVKGVVTTRDLLYTSRAMKVAMAGDYALASGQMNMQVVINHGRGEIQAMVTGTAASPSIRVNPAATVKGLDPGRAKSGLEELLKKIR